MRVAGYIRVSTEEQTKGYSLETQLAEIRRLCEARQWLLVKHYSDAGESGTLPPLQLLQDEEQPSRAGLTELIDQGEAKAFELVLVTNIDRLSRELSDMWPIIKILFGYKIGVATTTIPDVTSLVKEFYLTYGGMAGMTQYFLMNLKEVTGRGIREAKEKGKHLGRVPRGFYLGDDGYLHPDELGEKALTLLNVNPEMKLSSLVLELRLEDVNQAYKLKAACLRYGKSRTAR